MSGSRLNMSIVNAMGKLRSRPSVWRATCYICRDRPVAVIRGCAGMKLKSILITCAAQLVGLGSSSYLPILADECEIDVSPTSRVVASVGTGTVEATPDRVLVGFEVGSTNKDVNGASDEVNARTKKMLAIASSLHIPSENVHVSKLNVATRHGNSWGKGESVSGFTLTRRISFLLTDTNELENLLKTALNAGVSELQWIQFDLSDSARYRTEAKVRAVRAARQQAEAMASELKQRVGKVLLLKEISQTAETRSPRNGYFKVSPRVIAAGGLDEFAVDQISISSSVSATFELTDDQHAN